MPVPEAAVNENRGLILRENDVRSARQITAVQAETVTEPVQRPPHRNFRLSVFTFHARHQARTLRGDVVELWATHSTG